MSLSIPLQPLEIMARNHAILSTVGFLILLPIGALIPRYTRTFTNAWFPAHFVFQLFLSAPVILSGWYYGWKTSQQLALGHFLDPHQKMGLTLLILYVIQLFVGLFVHFLKTPSPFGVGTRPPQNYFHVFLGLVILILAAEQVHYGLYTEWAFATGGLHVVPMSAKDAWIAFIVIFWVLYLIGLALVPKQYTQERRTRNVTKTDEVALNGASKNNTQV